MARRRCREDEGDDMSGAVNDEVLLNRIDRLESYQAIQQLAARYALSVDSKDIDAIAELFVDDVNAGREWGIGRDAIKRFYHKALSRFYRSMHLIAGHVITFDDGDRAHGVVHCRAEHEAGSQWGIMVMNYKDDYERHAGAWFFRRRRLQPLYTTEILSRPTGPGFLRGWAEDAESSSGEQTRLPGEFQTFAAYWRDFTPDHIGSVTADPVETSG
jgi:ketosteroid isomerase-like protein